MARGFTLLEMAIVLVVVGLIISGGLFAVTPIIDGARVTQTEQRLDTIEKALTLYVMLHGCLPCPTDGSDIDNAEGLAAGTSATYSTGCADASGIGGDCDITDGDAVVSWGTLGLSRDDATDGWGNYITYVVDGDLITSSSMVRTPPSSYPAGGLEVESAGGSALTAAAAYVLISHGPDGFGARTVNGTTNENPNTSNTAQVENAAGACSSASPCHQDWPVDVDGDSKFDDVVRWRSAPMIIQMCGDNACGNPA